MTNFFARSGAFLLLIALPLAWSSAAALDPPTNSAPTLILVAGAPGETEYGSNFVRQVELWSSTAARAKAITSSIGFGATTNGSDFDQLKQTLATQAREAAEPLWLVFIGHGTFDGREAKFNLRGPDVSTSQLSEWLAGFRRPLVIINTASASAPFINKLSGTNRVIITATRSGNEQNFTRFGQFFAEAVGDPKSDLDKDGQTSVLEAFLSASAQAAEFYKTEGRLATEHALLDDNGDGRGTPGDWFRGVRAIKKPEDSAAVDGPRAHQFHLVLGETEQMLPPEIRARRDEVELALAQLRDEKGRYSEEAYYAEIEKLLAQLLEAYGNHLR